MRNVFVAIAACLTLMATALPAQEPSAPAREPGKTWPWVYNHIPMAVAHHHATPAELKAIESNLLKIADLLKATPILNPPVGFDARYVGTLQEPDVDLVGRVTAIPYWLEFTFMDYLEARPGDTRRPTFPNRGLDFFINDSYKLMHTSTVQDRAFSQRWWQDGGGEFWIEPPSDDFHGLRFYRMHDVLAVTRGGAPVWRPVPVARFLPIYLAEKKKGAASADARLASARRAYDEVTSPEAEAKHTKEVEAARAGSGAEQEIRRLEKIRQRRVDDAKAAMAVNPSNPKDKWYFAPRQALATAEALAASLGAEGGKAPACITGNTFSAEQWEYLLVPDGTAACHRIVEPNLGMFDNSLPRTAMQMIVVTGIRSCEGVMKGTDKRDKSWPGGCPGTVTLANQIDWEKVAALLGR